MLSPKTQYNLANAKEYFEEHLSTGDYYAQEERIPGEWFGVGAADLQLSGKVAGEDFLKLCENIHPRDGGRLTQRLKTTRVSPGLEESSPNRRVFYDFTISPPKSVSIVALVGGDQRILSAHDRAVTAALQELERFAATRVRIDGSFSDRNTSNLVCAIFRHDTSRALDPHLHSHCIVFNATHDPVETRWKALENCEMLRAQKYVENVYYHELARSLRRLGYEIENKPRGDFEIKGIREEVLQRFSKRHREIDTKTAELLETKPNLTGANIKDIRENVAHNERLRKIKNVSTDDLRKLWNSQISDKERQAIIALQSTEIRRLGAASVAKAISWAEDHVFDRRSVVPEYELWRHALERARGEDMPVSKVQSETKHRAYVRQDNQVTTKAVLKREWEIVRLAKDGIGQFLPFSPNHPITSHPLDEDQRKAVVTILSSKDFITLFRGGAGTGKSYALKEVKAGLEKAGHRVQVVAPQRQQVADLERDGFAEAQTISEFLARQSMISSAVVIVDEAGQIGAKQMQALLRCARENHGRLILSGDTRQHGAVEASDALRAIEKYAGLHAAELHEIRRQDPALGKTHSERSEIRQYRQAVKEASSGRLAASFELLDKQGSILTCSPFEQQASLAAEYVTLALRKSSVVVVSQTWTEVHKVNECVRSSLKSAGLLGKEEKQVLALIPEDLTTAQKQDRRFYGGDAVVVLNRKAGGLNKGQVCRFLHITRSKIVLEAEGRIYALPLRQAERLSVFRRRELHLASGDKLQLKANAAARQGERVSNGELVTVEKVLADGGIRLTDGRILEKEYRQFVRGFAVTSYSSQGKTVDYVLFSDSAIKAATNRQQWYVTISRGRRGIRVFTTDKAQLCANIARSGERTLALDLQANAIAKRQKASHRSIQSIGARV